MKNSQFGEKKNQTDFRTDCSQMAFSYLRSSNDVRGCSCRLLIEFFRMLYSALMQAAGKFKCQYFKVKNRYKQLPRVPSHLTINKPGFWEVQLRQTRLFYSQALQAQCSKSRCLGQTLRWSHKFHGQSKLPHHTPAHPRQKCSQFCW